MDKSTRCDTCGQTLSWHEAHQPRHEFQTESGPMVEVPPPEPSGRPTLGLGDPVLRIALVRAGLISPEDLESAEKEFNHARATGVPLILATAPSDARPGGETFAHLPPPPNGDGAHPAGGD